MSKISQELTKRFDGTKFCPGQSGVFRIISKHEKWARFSYYCAKKKKWNGGWSEIVSAYAYRHWFKECGNQGIVEGMIDRGDFMFRGLKEPA